MYDFSNNASNVTFLADLIDECGKLVNYSPVFFKTMKWKIRESLSLMYAKNSGRN